MPSSENFKHDVEENIPEHSRGEDESLPEQCPDEHDRAREERAELHRELKETRASMDGALAQIIVLMYSMRMKARRRAF